MQKTVLLIEGMNTEGCADLVQAALHSTPGVDSVQVSLLNNRASVRFDEQHTSPDNLARALADAGYPATARPASGCCGACGGG